MAEGVDRLVLGCVLHWTGPTFWRLHQLEHCLSRTKEDNGRGMHLGVAAAMGIKCMWLNVRERLLANRLYSAFPCQPVVASPLEKGSKSFHRFISVAPLHRCHVSRYCVLGKILQGSRGHEYSASSANDY